jgi:hypothetical protein
VKHTIVIEIPDEIETHNAERRAVVNLPQYIETAITGATERALLWVGGREFQARVVEYHHEQMTQPDEDDFSDPEDDVT